MKRGVLLVFFMILLSSIVLAGLNTWTYVCGCPTTGVSTKDAQNPSSGTSWGCQSDAITRYYCGTRGSFGISCPNTYATAYFTCPTQTCTTTDVCEGNDWLDYPVYDSATRASCQDVCITTPTGTSSTKADAGDTACRSCGLDCTVRRAKVIGKCNVQCLSNSDCTDPNKPVCDNTDLGNPSYHSPTYRCYAATERLIQYENPYCTTTTNQAMLPNFALVESSFAPTEFRYAACINQVTKGPTYCVGPQSITTPVRCSNPFASCSGGLSWLYPANCVACQDTDGNNPGANGVCQDHTGTYGDVAGREYYCDVGTRKCTSVTVAQPPVITAAPMQNPSTPNEGSFGFVSHMGSCNWKGFLCDSDDFTQSLDLFGWSTPYPDNVVSVNANLDNSDTNVASICGGNSGHEFILDTSSIPYSNGYKDMRIYGKDLSNGIYFWIGGSTCPSVSEPYPTSIDKLYYVPIIVNTDVASSCRFSTVDTTYSSMNYYVMKSSDNLNHKLGFSEYQGGTNNIYVRCKGIANGLENTQSTLIQFNIDPTLAKCTNRNKDTDETDYNCGNVCVSLGKTCEIGKSCNVNSDCTSNICNAQKKCEAPPVCTINKIGWGVYRAGNLIGEAYYNVVDGNSDKANLIDPNNMDSDDNGAIEVLYTDELEAILETSACTDTQKSAFAPEIYESDFATDTKRETLTSLSISTTNSNQLRKRWTGLQNVPDLERKEQFYLRVNPESPPIETEDPSIICGNTVIDTNYGEECDDSATPVYSGDNDGTCKKFNSFYKLGSLACGEPGTSDACLIDESQCVFDDEQLEALFDDPGEEACLASVQAGNKATFSVGECIDGSKTVNCQVPSGCEGIQEALDVFCRGEETRQVICLTQLEEPFPVFTGFNILIVTLLLGGYYLIRRKN